MIDRRNIQIQKGDLSIAAESLFDDIEESENIILLVANATEFDLTHRSNATQLGVQISAKEFDELAIAWCKKRKL